MPCCCSSHTCKIIVNFFLGVIPSAIAWTFFGIYLFHWQIALDFQEYGEAIFLSLRKEVPKVPFYDMCGVEPEPNSHWSKILAFNCILYFLLAICTICLWLSWLSRIVGALGILGHGLGFCLHVYAITILGIFRFSEDGLECTKYIVPVKYTDTGKTFVFLEHGERL